MLACAGRSAPPLGGTGRLPQGCRPVSASCHQQASARPLQPPSPAAPPAPSLALPLPRPQAPCVACPSPGRSMPIPLPAPGLPVQESPSRPEPEPPWLRPFRKIRRGGWPRGGPPQATGRRAASGIALRTGASLDRRYGAEIWPQAAGAAHVVRALFWSPSASLSPRPDRAGARHQPAPSLGPA
jgi:hypothetical protein